MCEYQIIEVIIQGIISLVTIAAIGTLAYQMYKDRKSEKWNQAKKVCCWSEGIVTSTECAFPDDYVFPTSIIISNLSSQPIYDVKVSLQVVLEERIDDSHDNGYEYVQCVPPGEYRIIKEWRYYGMNKTFNAAISFRDVAGNYWVRNGIGVLVEDKSDRSGRLMLPETQAIIERIK